MTLGAVVIPQHNLLIQGIKGKFDDNDQLDSITNIELTAMISRFIESL